MTAGQPLFADLASAAVLVTLLTAPLEWPSAIKADSGMEAHLPRPAGKAPWLRTWRPCAAVLTSRGHLQASTAGCKEWQRREAAHLSVGLRRCSPSSQEQLSGRQRALCW